MSQSKTCFAAFANIIYMCLITPGVKTGHICKAPDLQLVHTMDQQVKISKNVNPDCGFQREKKLGGSIGRVLKLAQLQGLRAC